MTLLGSPSKEVSGLDKSTIIGIVLGVVVVAGGIITSDGSGGFWNFPSLVIVLGGTLASTAIAYPWEQLKRVPKALRQVLSPDNRDIQELIDQIIQMDEMARRHGLLALDEQLDTIEDPFLRRGVMLVVDGADKDNLQDVLEAEIFGTQQEIDGDCRVFETMAGMAPGFGMVGTLIGLINMLSNLEDAESVAPAMAVALITTLYGVLMANLIFSPTAAKLAARGEQRLRGMEVILAGVMGIQAGENPRNLRESLEVIAGLRREVSHPGTERPEEAQSSIEWPA